jgi:hypothetical protein
MEFPIDVNVIGSIAGGTGSGMLIDVLCIVQKALEGKAKYVYPWVVLPDVFRAMASGPAMANVFYNAYGALRELDYLCHHDPMDLPIDFGYMKVSDNLFDFAYIINNVDTTGNAYNHIKDIADVVAKSAYLPANEIGDTANQVFDNIRSHMSGTIYDILNKRAWAASVGSAELLYDGKQVATANVHRIVSQLCISMLQSPDDGTADANRFVDDADVKIRENLGKDDVIDALLSKEPPYYLDVNKNTSLQEVMFYVDTHSKEAKLESDLKANFKAKLENTKVHFEKYIFVIMSRPQGKVDGAIKFILVLKEIIALCKGEMEDEEADFRRTTEIPVAWDSYIKDLKSWMGLPNQAGVDALQSKVTEVTCNHRELIRRSWALKFYNAFEDVINHKLNELDSLKNAIRSLADDHKKMLVALQFQKKADTKFQLFLHEQDLQNASQIEIDDVIKNDFVTFLGNGVSSWIGQSKENIQREMVRFAETTSSVLNASRKNIDDVLRQMPRQEVERYIERMKMLASAMWKNDTLGFTPAAMPIDRQIIVGVGDRDNSYLMQEYGANFSTGFTTAIEASTQQYDRVYLMIIEDLLPIYAVQNFVLYKSDSDLKSMMTLTNYIDEKLNQRIKSEMFDMIPKGISDNALEMWVLGFVFGLIKYDAVSGKYCIKSKKKGNAFNDFRFNLSSQRNVAFDIFKSEGLKEEVADWLSKQADLHGKPYIEDRISKIKRDASYYRDYADLAPTEKAHIEEPNFKAVHSLVEKEIKLMTE